MKILRLFAFFLGLAILLEAQTGSTGVTKGQLNAALASKRNVSTTTALASNALALTPQCNTYEATWSSATSNRTLTFASGATTAGNAVIFAATFGDSTTITFPAAYRNGATTTITSYTYTAGRRDIKWIVAANGSSIIMKDEEVSLAEIPGLGTGVPERLATPVSEWPAGGSGSKVVGEYFPFDPTKGTLPTNAVIADGTKGTSTITALVSGVNWYAMGSPAPSAPTFSPAAGAVASGTVVTITGTNVHHTYDGSTPSRTVGTNSTSRTITADGTLKAVDSPVIGPDSSVASAAYTISVSLRSVTDNFNSYADAAVLGSQTNWENIVGTIMIYNPSGTAGGLYASSSAEQICAYTNGTWAANQAAQITQSTPSGGGFRGASVRCSTASGGSGYYFLANATNVYLKARNAGTSTDLTSASITISGGETLRLEVTGTGSATRLTVKINGTAVISSFDPSAVAYISAGAPGVSGYGLSASQLGDAFLGEEL